MWIAGERMDAGMDEEERNMEKNEMEVLLLMVGQVNMNCLDSLRERGLLLVKDNMMVGTQEI